MARRGRWALVAAIWTAFGLFQTFLWIGVVDAPVVRPTQMLPLSLATAWLWASLTPLIARTVRAVRWEHGRRTRYIALHLACAAAAAAIDALVRRAALGLILGQQASYLELFLWRLDLNLFSYFAVVSVVHALDYQRLYRDRKLRAAQLRTQLARAQLQVLTVQLRPHFLFNTLHTISELVHRDPAMAERMLSRLGDLLRLSLEHGHEQEVSLRTELSLLEAYLDIQRTRFRERLTVQLEVEPALLDASVPHFILQPLVENAIRHGVTPRAGPGLIRLGVREKGGRLEIEIRDNGVGLAGRYGARVEGIGLRNTRARLRQLYGMAQALELRDAPTGGAVVTLTIPLRAAAHAAAAAAEAEAQPEPDGPSILLRTGEWSIGEDAIPPPVRPAARAAARSTSAAAANVSEREATAHGSPAAAEERPTTVRLPLAPRTLLARAVGLIGIWSLIGLFWTEQAHLFIHTIDEPVPPFGQLARFYLSIAWIWAALTPAIIWLAHRLPVDRSGWRSAIPLHICIALGVAAAHLGLHRLVYGYPSGAPLLTPNSLPQFYWNLSSYLVILALTHARDFARGYRERDVQAARLEAELANAELQLVTMQLHPTFLLTTLDTIAAFARTDPARADRMIVRLGDLLRLMLQDVPGREYTLARELDFVHAYLAIWRTRVDDRLEVVFQVEPEALDARVPRLVLHPLVESLLETATGPDTARRVLEIEARRAQDEQLAVHMRVGSADGGRIPQPIRHGAVLRATRMRLQQLFGPGHRLDTEIGRDGALLLTLAIPFEVDDMVVMEARAAS